jgi:starch phosphorylase
MMVERVREEVQAGKSFEEARNSVKATTVFTTHTPVLAGHDVFPTQLVEKYFEGYWQRLGIDKQTFLQLGCCAGIQDFNMTAFALKMSEQRCAVSKLHGGVTRRMWQMLWPDVSEDEVPISHVTNGVHVPSWIAREVGDLFTKYLGSDWTKECDNTALWQRVLEIPDKELWEVHLQMKLKLIAAIRERMRNWWAHEGISLQQMMTMGALVEPDVLTIAFARRFTEYKRATLIFRDAERLKRIICDPSRPVQIIFAGKSHPADFPSKYILQQVYNLAKSLEFKGRIVFVEDYDMHAARYLVQGVDVWLNTPRRLQEACGTSGMKAALNGVLHLSVRDGWWHEGYNGANGWAIDDNRALTPEDEDRADAEAVYELLEKQIVPLYYARDRKGIPHGWTSLIKESIRSIAPVFSARRMLKEYIERTYDVATRSLVEIPGRDI